MSYPGINDDEYNRAGGDSPKKQNGKINWNRHPEVLR